MNRLFFVIYLLISVSITAQTKRALVIGIGEQEDASWAKINGDKDVPYVEEMLNRAGYNYITTLVNKQATKASIVEAFNFLTTTCRNGDIVYIHFSGHGQQVTDINGDEDDGWDEAWIPYDAYLKYGENDKGEKHLIDDEISILLTKIRNKIGNDGKLLVVVDACHSGGSTRGIKQDIPVRGIKDEFVIPITNKKKSTKVPMQWITLSACEDFQINQEISCPQVGKLTYTLYSLAQEGNLSIVKIEAFMDKYRGRLPQTPVLRPLFSNISVFLK